MLEICVCSRFMGTRLCHNTREESSSFHNRGIRGRFPRRPLTTNITQYCVLKPAVIMSSWSQPSIVVPVSVLSEANAGPSKGSVNENRLSECFSSPAGVQCQKNAWTRS